MRVIKEDRLLNCQEDESLLWQKFKTGDKDAYAYFYSQYAAFLFRYGCKILSDREVLKDCLHDLFAELWRTKENLGNPSSVKNYLVKSFRNKLVRELDKQSKFVSTEEILNEQELGEVDSHELGLIDSQTKSSKEQQLIKALRKLSNRQKEIIFLMYYNNLTAVEVAAIMSVSVRTIYNTTFNAIQSLRSEMVISISVCIFITFEKL